MGFVGLKPTIVNGTPVAGQNLTVSATATSFMAFSSSSEAVAIQVIGGDIYCTLDGTSPSSSNGAKLYNGQNYTWDCQTAQRAKFVRVSATATAFLQEMVAALGATEWPDASIFKGKLLQSALTSGTVTSIGITGPSGVTWSTSSISTAGTFTGTWANEGANTFLSGPSSGSSSGAVTWRKMATADLPNLPIYRGFMLIGTIGSSAFQVISSGTETTVTWNSTIYDDLSIFDGVSTFTIPNTISKIKFTGNAVWDVNATGTRNIKLKSNAGNILGYALTSGDSSKLGGTPLTSGWIPVSSLSITSFTVTVYQSSGGNLNLEGGATGNSFISYEAVP